MMSLRRVLLVVAVVLLFVLKPVVSFGHCQIPCGIYDDEVRFKLLAEHITTIEKSMNKINELSSAEVQNMNQLIRWVNNKEEHAVMFSDIVTDYFMAQRVVEIDAKLGGYDSYVKKVTLLHSMLRYAMKCKQTADTANTSKLSELLEEFRDLYLSGN